jgi:hypothetical protein
MDPWLAGAIIDHDAFALQPVLGVRAPNRIPWVGP